MDNEDSTIFRTKHIAIGKFDRGWWVGQAQKAKGTGADKEEDTWGRKSWHGTLAGACANAALRETDAAEAQTLRTYAATLESSIRRLEEFCKTTENQAYALSRASVGVERQKGTSDQNRTLAEA